MKSVVVITPTVGSDHLIQCVESVAKQTYQNVKHMVVVDGSENNWKYSENHECTIRGTLYEMVKPNLTVHMLDNNVGGDGWYGHRIYAAFSYLVNEDYVCFLDEDNWLEPDHVEKMVENIEQNNLNWTHCLRNIYRKDGTFACRDECESLGSKPIWVALYKGIANQYHIDTSSFMVRREALVHVAGAWYGQWGADRQFFQALKRYFPNWKTTENYSLNYRLDGNPGSVTKEFFLEGNKYMRDKL